MTINNNNNEVVVVICYVWTYTFEKCVGKLIWGKKQLKSKFFKKGNRGILMG